MKFKRIFCILAAVIITSTWTASVAQKKGGGQSSGTGNGQGNQGGGQGNQGNQSGQSNSGNQPSQPAGITGGSSPIESTMFSYMALAADAEKIARAIQTHHAAVAERKYVVTTANDIPIFLQWRTTIGQAELLLGRVNTTRTALAGIPNTIISGNCNEPATAPAAVGAPFIAGPGDIQTLLQTLASITAVNETLTPSAGALTDLPLMNLVAGKLGSIPVFVPSLLPPGVLSGKNLGNGPLGQALLDLETARREGLQSSGTTSGLIQDWQTVSNGKLKCTDAQKMQAAALLATWKPRLDALNSALLAIDAFESSLFSGQAPPTPTQTGGNANATPVVGATPVPPGSNSNPGNSPPPSLQPSNAPTGSILQQVLVADLLYRQLLKDNNGADSDAQLRYIHFVEVHVLESGGGLLTKSNLFLGSRNFFSGGTVATFSLFDADGKIECGGFAYAYQGFVKSDQVAAALSSNPTAVIKSDCH